MNTASVPRRPAWIEIDLSQFRENLRQINSCRAPEVAYLAVVKDQAYGHGAVEISRVCAQMGASYLAVSTLDEALELRQHHVSLPILIFGERPEAELEICAQLEITCCLSDPSTAARLSVIARSLNKKIPFHIEIDTGMGRYGIPWRAGTKAIHELASHDGLVLEGLFSHFAMSDELDKTFAHQQIARFNNLTATLEREGVSPRWLHLSNSGGFLDLKEAHCNLVRLGLLPLGIFPSEVCRRIPEVRPIMSVKTRVAALRKLKAGDNVGYGLRYSAEGDRTIAVLPIGYGDGFPRLRNRGAVLIRGKRCPLVGGNSMDATMVDVTDIPAVEQWDEAVLMGRQGTEEISVREVADWKQTVSYEVLTSWRSRLPRVYLPQKA